MHKNAAVHFFPSVIRLNGIGQEAPHVFDAVCPVDRDAQFETKVAAPEFVAYLALDGTHEEEG